MKFDIETLTANKIRRNAGTCDKCGYELIAVQDIRGEHKTQPCGRCSIERDRVQSEKSRREDAVRAAWMAQCDEKYRDVEWGDYIVQNEAQARIINTIHEWVDNFTVGKWLVLFGNQGTGKTMLTNCIIKSLAEKDVSMKKTSQREMFSDYTESMKLHLPSPEGKYTRYDLLIIEEVGRTSPSDALRSFMFSIVDTIYRKKKSLLITSNLMIEAVHGNFGIADFIDNDRLHEMSTFVPFGHESYRRQYD